MRDFTEAGGIEADAEVSSGFRLSVTTMITFRFVKYYLKGIQTAMQCFFCPLCFCFSLQRAVVGLNVPLRVHWNCQRHLRQAVHKLLSAQQKASESVCTVQSA